MSANLVIVRSFRGIPLVRALLDTTPTAAFVCKPEDVAEIRRGAKPEPMIGFPRNDVFQFAEATARAIDLGQSVEWGKLKPI